MYAIIRDRGGNQYRAEEGKLLQIDLMADATAGQSVEFTDVLLTSDGAGQVKVGKPTVSGAKVTATVVNPSFKGKKIDVVHFRRRKDSMTMVGHRQRYTHVKIEKIEG